MFPARTISTRCALCTRRVQVFFDKETNTIVSNESLDIWRILDSSFQVTVRARVGTGVGFGFLGLGFGSGF